MRHPALRFAIVFAALILALSILVRLEAVERSVVVPFTGLVARVSHVLLNAAGLRTEVSGTMLVGEEGFAVNILNGCNGVYVTGIVLSAVLAFPATWREKALGVGVGVAGVQIINLARIVTLYYIGLRHPAVFEQFHYYVWQTIVIILSMAIWIFWAEVLVGSRSQPRAR